jgi:hypothetical protein
MSKKPLQSNAGVLWSKRSDAEHPCVRWPDQLHRHRQLFRQLLKRRRRVQQRHGHGDQLHRQRQRRQ